MRSALRGGKWAEKQGAKCVPDEKTTYHLTNRMAGTDIEHGLFLEGRFAVPGSINEPAGISP